MRNGAMLQACTNIYSHTHKHTHLITHYVSIAEHGNLDEWYGECIQHSVSRSHNPLEPSGAPLTQAALLEHAGEETKRQRQRERERES